jgi:Tfp pilus assembly protein PilZ
VKQRSPVRKRKKLLAQFHDRTGGLCTGWTRDLSPTGLFVVSDPMPAVGEAVVLKLHLPRGIILELEGTVVRVGRGSTSIEGSAPMGFGFKLTKTDEGYFKLFETL